MLNKKYSLNLLSTPLTIFPRSKRKGLVQRYLAIYINILKKLNGDMKILNLDISPLERQQ